MKSGFRYQFPCSILINPPRSPRHFCIRTLPIGTILGFLTLFLTFSLLFTPIQAQYKQFLPTHWTITPKNIPTSLPTTVQEAYYLSPTAIKPYDFYQEGGEKAILWMEAKTWTFTTEFTPDPSIFQSEHIHLTFPCLDTYAEIILNGEKIGTANNYFREWTFDVKPWLKADQNKLKVIFSPTVAEGKKAKTKLGYELPAGNDAGEIKVAPYVRKPQFHFGWDWGPRIVTTGIRAIPFLEGTPPLSVGRHNYQIANITDQTASIPFEVEIEWHSDSIRWLKWNIGDAETGKVWRTLHAQLVKGKQTLYQQIEIDNPIL